MNMSFEITVENLRRFEKVHLSFQQGSRVIVIGRNNSGKTTLLDAIARSFWSLSAAALDHLKEFHVSWYRRTATAFHRPRITLSVAAKELDAELCRNGDAIFEFEQIGQRPSISVTRLSNYGSKLITRRCDLKEGDDRKVVFEMSPHGQGQELSPESNVVFCQKAISREPWNTTVNELDVSGVSGLTMLSVPDAFLARAMARLARRVIYLPASRAPQFQARADLSEISQDNFLAVTSLMLMLHSTNPPAFREVASAMSLLFPEVADIGLNRHENGVVAEVRFSDGRLEDVGNLGFGFQNALHLLTIVHSLASRSVLLIDEPEIGLNQSCQRDFAAILETVRPDVTLIIATQAEVFCRGFSAGSQVMLAESNGESSAVTKMDLENNVEDLRRLAEAMGIDPLYLSEGGKILYVEGVSDQIVMSSWILGEVPTFRSRCQIVALGGSGNINQEFVKPLLLAYRDRVFVMLDSDRSSSSESMSRNAAKLADWLQANSIRHYVLKRRELENYIGSERIARAAGLHPGRLAALVEHEEWHDIKAAYEREAGCRYDERRLTVKAFEFMREEGASGCLFGDESQSILVSIKSFLSC